MRRAMLASCVYLLSLSAAFGAEYYRNALFEIPNPLETRTESRCDRWATTEVPCPTWNRPFRTCPGGPKICVAHTVTTFAKRYKVSLVVTGPDSAQGAVRQAVVGVAALCGARAYSAAVAAAALMPELASKVTAASAAAYGTFQGCISTASVGTVAAGIVNQLSVKLETSNHWARL